MTTNARGVPQTSRTTENIKKVSAAVQEPEEGSGSRCTLLRQQRIIALVAMTKGCKSDIASSQASGDPYGVPQHEIVAYTVACGLATHNRQHANSYRVSKKGGDRIHYYAEYKAHKY
ncbi:hypothetical protein TNCV_1799421 [Trichonephila clavipes]|nr:hypothetical protein TNCV_1799421 [Trichonephila clavipes]